MRCEECKWNYPQYYLSNIMTSSKADSGKLVCGLCALKISNKALGVIRTEFSGPVAEALRQSAIKWRTKKPEQAPRQGIEI